MTRRLSVCATPQPDDLTYNQFAALTWVQVSGVGSLGETGTSTNIVNYDTWDDLVSQKSKGIDNAGDPELEVRSDAYDLGQAILVEAGGSSLDYAFRIEDHDGSIRYNRGLVTGPRQPNGRVEDFQLDVYTLSLNQRQALANDALPQNRLVLSGVPLTLSGAYLTLDP